MKVLKEKRGAQWLMRVLDLNMPVTEDGHPVSLYEHLTGFYVILILHKYSLHCNLYCPLMKVEINLPATRVALSNGQMGRCLDPPNFRPLPHRASVGTMYLNLYKPFPNIFTDI